MGLDNGIRIANKKRNDLRFWPFKYPFDKDYDGEVEVCYWRKCWGLRRDILSIVGGIQEHAYEYKLTIDDVKSIRKLIRRILRNANLWNDSIWEFEESERGLRDDAWNLWWLKLYMKLHPDEKVFFYDSY